MFEVIQIAHASVVFPPFLILDRPVELVLGPLRPESTLVLPRVPTMLLSVVMVSRGAVSCPSSIRRGTILVTCHSHDLMPSQNVLTSLDPVRHDNEFKIAH